MRYDTDLLNTKKRLTERGNWCYRITTMGLGYSNRTLLAKSQEEGGMIIQGTAKTLMPTNEKAEEMNDPVEQLAMDKPEGARMVISIFIISLVPPYKFFIICSSSAMP